jgi:single stranded DNA-binding protein
MSYQTKQTKNLVIVSGWVGDTPEVITTKFGQITKLRVSTTEAYTVKDTGEQVETTTWHDIGFFGNKAIFASKYIKKGMLIDVEGKLSHNHWIDQHGQSRISVEIKVDDGKEVRILRDPQRTSNNKPVAQQNAAAMDDGILTSDKIPM